MLYCVIINASQNTNTQTDEQTNKRNNEKKCAPTLNFRSDSPGRLITRETKRNDGMLSVCLVCLFVCSLDGLLLDLFVGMFVNLFVGWFVEFVCSFC